MKRGFSALIVVAGLFSFGAGCSKKESPPAKPANASSSSGNPLTAPVDYLGAVANAQQSAAKTVTRVGLEQSIKLFYGQEGRFPKDLNELVPAYINAVPPPPRGMKYSYDPKTGELKFMPQ
jgi:hypothetical protein